MRKTIAVGRKELRQILRDRRTLMILLFIPAFFLLLFGYALNFDIRHVRLAVEDRDGTPESRRLVSAFVNSGYFDLAAKVTSEREIRVPARTMLRNPMTDCSILAWSIEQPSPTIASFSVELQRRVPGRNRGRVKIGRRES